MSKKEKINIKKDSIFKKSANWMDDKTNPKIGKILYLFFKWTTLLFTFLVVPIFIISAQIANTKNGAIVETEVIIPENEDIYQIVSYKTTFSYEDINNSIDEVWNGQLSSDNIFLTPYLYYDQEGEGHGYSLFYAIFNPVENIDSADDWITSAELYLKVDPFILKNDLSFYLVSNYPPLNDKIPVNEGDEVDITASEAKEAFEYIYPPIGINDVDDQTYKIDLAIGWTFVGLIIILSLLWLWFARYKKIELKKEIQNKKEDDLNE